MRDEGRGTRDEGRGMRDERWGWGWDLGYLAVEYVKDDEERGNEEGNSKERFHALLLRHLHRHQRHHRGHYQNVTHVTNLIDADLPVRRHPGVEAGVGEVCEVGQNITKQNPTHSL